MQKGIVYQRRLTMSLAKIFPPADSGSKKSTLFVLPDSIPYNVIDEDGNPVANAKVVLNLITRGGGTPRIYDAVTDARSRANPRCTATGRRDNLRPLAQGQVLLIETQRGAPIVPLEVLERVFEDGSFRSRLDR